MAERFENLATAIDGDAVRARFRMARPAVVGWQLYDPVTSTFLWEGEWSEAPAEVDLRIPLPREDGAYRIQIAPVDDRDRFVQIDVEVADGRVAHTHSRVNSATAVRWSSLLQAIPKAFSYPLRSLRINRALIGSMVRRDILARYRGSFGGSAWTILNPLLLMLAYLFVFGIVLQARFPGDNSRSGFVLYFLAGMLPWLAFSEAVGRSPQLILEHRNFVKKLVFPLEILPVNATLTGLATEAFAFLVFSAVLLFARGAIPLTTLWLPVLVFVQLLFTLGLCWMLAAAGVFVRDLGQIIGFVLTLWFFLTPICYPEIALPAAALKILSLNPVFILVRGYRAVLLEGRAPEIISFVSLAVFSFSLAIAGYAFFHKLRKGFADVI
jgi:lipopolysaccharide transport system permease protein